ncbi:MAG TPA: hypothetical protein VE378_02815 [Nitrososphaeraceae archaeon]|nr:hypothetical protein [Nitrososphaeraceae archaeon]
MVRLSGGMKKLIRSYLSDARGMTMTVLKCVNCYLILPTGRWESTKDNT